MTRDHGGDIDRAIARFGGKHEEWIDLSTGINRVPYPVPPLGEHALRSLPTRADIERLVDAARRRYATCAAILPVAGAQAAIQLLPLLERAPSRCGTARILSPTYNEHAASWRSAGWRIEEAGDLAGLVGAAAAVVVNPNNPEGRAFTPNDLLELSGRVARLVVDESFADHDAALSLAPDIGTERGVFVLRSFGKFYGLAGIRLGFVIGHEDDISSLAAMAGPWPVSGPAIAIGALALADDAWAGGTARRLEAETLRLDALAVTAGWQPAGGSALFRLYETPDAGAAQAALARSRIWSRIFPYSSTWLRLGIPGGQTEWSRVADALGAMGE
ncbi:MAG: threonine-phosphate decarboxylase [Rhizobiales bacterium]|nr:threonine-phosphate decarboxylase [Hyphomicrobiales bacterium]